MTNIYIYYDGACRLCSGITTKIKHSSRAASFTSVDIRRSTLPSAIDKEESLRNVHVLDGSGRVYAGMPAIVRILSEYPRWKWAATLLMLPGFKQLGAGMYRIVAMNRHRL